MNLIRGLLGDGRVVVTCAAVWAAFDAVVHVLVDQVEALRIAGNAVTVTGAALAVLVDRSWRRSRTATLICGLSVGLTVGFNGAWIVNEGELPVPAAVFIFVAVLLTSWAGVRFIVATDVDDDAPTRVRVTVTSIVTVTVAAVVGLGSFVWSLSESLIRQLHTDRLESADYWAEDLRILSAGFGFDNIVGVPDDGLETTRRSGATWLENPDCVEGEGPLSSAVVDTFIGRLSRGTPSFDDGLPIVTTWPVLASTMHPEDYLFTLNDGSQVVPNAVTMVPNWELNERTTMVVFGDFGNRARADEPDLLFPVKLEIVDDGSPLMFVGPGGVVQSGVGLTFETDNSPYFEGATGPRLTGAKLNRVGDAPVGEGGVSLLESNVLPNDEFALYGGGDFKVRVLTTGGFSPDGLTGVTPDQFEDFFRLHATGPSGETVLMTEVGVDYELDGGTLRVVGLSDLGKPAGDGVHYDDCYIEDSDNYIDIVLVGDEAAARGVTIVEIPADVDGYSPFFNPGGPGPDPFDDVRYNQPGPRDLEPVVIALDDPMRISYP